MRISSIFGGFRAARVAPVAAVLAVAVLAAGCSTDVQRFGHTGAAAPTAALGAPIEPVSSSPLAVPAPNRQNAGSAYTNGATYDTASYTTPATAYARSAPSAGSVVTVGSGDTAFSIARNNGVTVEQLAAANGLSYPYAIQLGQRLSIPGGGAAPLAVPAPVRVASRDATGVGAAAGGTHVVAPGDTLFNISQRYGVGVGAIADANRLDNYGSIKIGQSLAIPSGGAAAAVGGPLEVASRDTGAADARVLEGRAIESGPGGEEAVALVAPTPTPAATDADSDASNGKFRWPVRGRIIAHYGIGADGQRNDGINISVPEGASVKAAETGVVAYAGSELKGYGNLVLVRHANDWVTAYAHNSEILVQRGDTVQRGQIIAKAGQTGSVDKPQVHFEVRQGSKAVDPMPYLEGA